MKPFLQEEEEDRAEAALPNWATAVPSSPPLFTALRKMVRLGLLAFFTIAVLLLARSIFSFPGLCFLMVAPSLGLHKAYSGHGEAEEPEGRGSFH